MQLSQRASLFVARASIFAGVATLAGTILWLNPLPDPYFMSCERPCHELDWPMICRVRLTLEVYQTLSSSCGQCPSNQTDCWSPYCVTADGHKRGILTANRQLPGPSIQVCENDIMVVDVVNRVPGHGLAVHWRGLPQRDTPFMDGVPMLTQCPIPSYTTFQYKFRASRPGTHLWHAHGGAEMADGLVGSFVVRRPPSREPHRALYDEDRSEHVLLLAEWTRGFALQRLLQERTPRPDSLLLNGRGSSQSGVPLAQFVVSAGKRYRFRLAHAGVISACAIKVTIDSHTLKVIEVDGSPIKPREVSSVTLASGERVDVVLHADQTPNTYEVLAESQCADAPHTRQTAELRYETSEEAAMSIPSSAPSGIQLDTASHECGDPDDEQLCLTELEALEPADPALTKAHMDMEIQLPFDFSTLDNENTSYPSYVVSQSGGIRVPHVANFSFMYPPSPLVTQASDVPVELLCHAGSRPASCSLPGVCECVHQIDIPLSVSVQLVLSDYSREGGDGHVFHLHGHSFHVVRSLPGTKLKLSPAKDTVTVPPGGSVTLRFIADNPGYWLLQDQHVGHSARGLSVVLHVGGAWDLPAVPPDFPKCGSWRGPDFFLT